MVAIRRTRCNVIKRVLSVLGLLRLRLALFNRLPLLFNFFLFRSRSLPFVVSSPSEQSRPEYTCKDRSRNAGLLPKLVFVNEVQDCNDDERGSYCHAVLLIPKTTWGAGILKQPGSACNQKSVVQ